jgi:hypothetical protein
VVISGWNPNQIGTFGTEGNPMRDEPKRPAPSADYVRKVSQETGTTEQQVREIIFFVGFNHSSVMRKALLLKGNKK